MFEPVQVLWAFLVARVQVAREDDTGASALEWAIIAAVSVVMATLIGGIIYKIVDSKSTAIDNCGSQAAAPGGKC